MMSFVKDPHERECLCRKLLTQGNAANFEAYQILAEIMSWEALATTSDMGRFSYLLTPNVKTSTTCIDILDESNSTHSTLRQ